MYAVIKTGGKQYRVAPNDKITVERLPGEAGSKIELDQVLLVNDGETTTAGTPLVAGAMVAAELVEQARGDKIIVFKKNRRQGYRRTRGHRQDLTVLRIEEILTDGKKPAAKKKAAPKKAAPKKTAAKKKAEDKAVEDKAPTAESEE